MCMLCVEIIRERITMRDAIDNIKEGFMAGKVVDEHRLEILDAQNDIEKLKKLVLEGYKKERWI